MENKQTTNTPANMGKRIMSGLVILLVLAGFILVRQISESTVFLFDILVGFLMLIGTFEVEGILRKMNRPAYTVGLGMFPILCFVMLALSVVYNLGYVNFLLMIAGALILVAIICFIVGISSKKCTLQQMYLDNFEGKRLDYVWQKTANTIFGNIYPTFLLCFLFLINHFTDFSNLEYASDIGLLGILLVFTSTMFADTSAMLCGRLIKTKKINLKKLGPGKSWSGLVGGIIGATIGAVVLFFILDNVGYAETFAEYGIQFWQFLVGGIFCGIFNMSGDITASYLKRRAGVKDFSDFIPGHGGIMDRINGLVFNSLFAFLFLVIMFLA